MGVSRKLNAVTKADPEKVMKKFCANEPFWRKECVACAKL
jgi:hypothetical protein